MFLGFGVLRVLGGYGLGGSGVLGGYGSGGLGLRERPVAVQQDR